MECAARPTIPARRATPRTSRLHPTNQSVNVSLESTLSLCTSGGRHRELHAGSVIVARIQKDRHAIGVGLFVARGHSPRDAGRVGVEQARADVQRVVVVEDANLGALGRGLTFIGIALPEVIGHRCLRPHFVGQAAVDDGRLGDANGAKHRPRAVSGSRRVRSGGRWLRLGRARCGNRQHRCCQEARSRRQAEPRTDSCRHVSHVQVTRQERDAALAPERMFVWKDLVLDPIRRSEDVVDLSHLIEALDARPNREDVVAFSRFHE